jgi:ParB/RepB/Spo0J family partition protein
MAVNFSVEHTRTSEYLIPPENIKLKPEMNGRHAETDVEDLIKSFVAIGQLQPVLIGKDGDKPILYAGHRRWMAAIEINRRKLTPAPFKLRCVYFQGSEQEAFRATVRENHDRRATTPIDDAHNIAKLERFGMTVAEIAELYGEKDAWVKDRRALADLGSAATKAVREGRLKPTQAKKLANLSKEAQAEAVKGKEKVTAKEVRKAEGKPQKAGLAEVRAALEDWINNGESPQGCPRPSSTAEAEFLTAFCGALLTLIDGKPSSDQLKLENVPHFPKCGLPHGSHVELCQAEESGDAA